MTRVMLPFLISFTTHPEINRNKGIREVHSSEEPEHSSREGQGFLVFFYALSFNLFFGKGPEDSQMEN